MRPRRSRSASRRARKGPRIFAADYYAEEVRRELTDMYGEKTLYEGGLSVRTSLDPGLQVMARQALIDGLIKFDVAHGWRGPVAHLDDLGEDWGVAVAGVPALADVVEWRLAVVLSVDGEKASIGLQPARDPGTGARRSRSRDRHHPLRPDEVGGQGQERRRGVLSVGDVVYVEKVDGPEGTYQLRQVPEIEGALVVDGPAHRPRAGHGRRLLLRREPVQSRHPGEPPAGLVVQAVRLFGRARQRLHALLGGDGCADRDRHGARHGLWRPENYGNEFLGPSTLRTGIELSRNVMTVRLAQDMGMPLVAEYARRFGVYDNMPPVPADGARRRRDDRAAHGRRATPSSPMAAARSSRR